MIAKLQETERSEAALHSCAFRILYLLDIDILARSLRQTNGRQRLPRLAVDLRLSTWPERSHYFQILGDFHIFSEGKRDKFLNGYISRRS